MAITTSTTLTQQSSGGGFVGPVYANTQTNVAGNPPSTAALTPGTNVTVPVPATAAGVLLRPDPLNGSAITLKGVAGDTGIALHPTQPTSLAFVAGSVASFVLQASTTTTVALLWQ